MSKTTVVTLGLILTLGAGSAAAQQPSAPLLDPTVIRRDVERLSGDAFMGRGPGEAGETATMDYMRAQFEAAGLEPGGEDGGWFQTVALTRFQRSGASASLSIGGAATPLALADDISVSSNTPGRTQVTDAPLVFVGFGVDAPELGYTQFEGADLTGKVAVMLMNDPDYAADGGPFGGRARSAWAGAGPKRRAAMQRGAVGVLFIHQFETASWPWQQLRNSDPDPKFVLGAPSASASTVMGPSGTLRWEAARDMFQRAGRDLDALALAARRPDFRPVALDGATFSMTFEIEVAPMTTRNILALKRGTDRADETVIYGAHWDAYGVGPAYENGDTVRNGAVDNGIGTATLLEIARAYAAAPAPRRSVLFIGYTSEEDGLLGAYHYVAHPLRPLETTATVFNLDPHLALPMTRSLEIIGPGLTPLEDDVARVAAAQGLSIEPEAYPEAGWYRRSDHYSFAEQGVPTVYFRAGRNLVEGGVARGRSIVEAYNTEDYHQRSDEFDPAWDLVAAAQEGSVAYALGREIADSDRWPDWRADAPYRARRIESDAARTGE